MRFTVTMTGLAVSLRMMCVTTVQQLRVNPEKKRGKDVRLGGQQLGEGGRAGFRTNGYAHHEADLPSRPHPQPLRGSSLTDSVSIAI